MLNRARFFQFQLNPNNGCIRGGLSPIHQLKYIDTHKNIPTFNVLKKPSLRHCLNSFSFGAYFESAFYPETAVFDIADPSLNVLLVYLFSEADSVYRTAYL